MNFFENLKNEIEENLGNNIKDNNINIKNSEISEEEIELAKKLNAIEEFTIDRFEEDAVVLENRKTQEIINLKKEELPEGAKTGDILKKINGKFFVDKAETKKVEDRIEQKMNHLWN